jgi:hypothetical protein
VSETRRFKNRKKSIPRDHPDGGTFHLFPFDIGKALDYEDLKGSWEELKTKETQKYRELVTFARANVVESISNFIDDDTDEPLESSDENICALLAEISERMVDVVVDGVTTQQPANEPGFVWAINESGKLLAKKEGEQKNS